MWFLLLLGGVYLLTKEDKKTPAELAATATDRGGVRVPVRSKTKRIMPVPPASRTEAMKQKALSAKVVKDRLAPGGLYRWRAGDTWPKVAKRFRVSLAALLAANPKEASGKVKLKQRIRIP